MNPAKAIALIDAAASALQHAISIAEDMLDSGLVTADEQTALQAKIDSLRKPQAFTGPEWEQSDNHVASKAP